MPLNDPISHTYQYDPFDGQEMTVANKNAAGRPVIRFTSESIMAIVSIARFWRKAKRKFTPNHICQAVYGYDGDGKVRDFVRNILDNNKIEYDDTRRKIAPVESPKPNPSICTHFVVTTDMHV
jgi:hypothetical protein